MHAVNLIASALPDGHAYPYPENPVPGICCITGQETMTLPRMHLLKPGFTDGRLLKAPNSARVGVEAWKAFTWNEMRGKRGFHPERMSSWICDGKDFIRLDRVGVRRRVFGLAPENPWVAYATTSYKKHGSLRAPVNSGSRRVWLFESRLVDLTDTGLAIDWWQRMNVALRSGFGRTIIETLQCPPHVVRKCGLSQWLDFEAWAMDKYRSAVYAFLCYLLPSREELAGEMA